MHFLAYNNFFVAQALQSFKIIQVYLKIMLYIYQSLICTKNCKCALKK